MPEKKLHVAAVLVAGGRGTRAGPGLPKQYRAIGGAPVLVHSLSRLLASADIDCVVPVIHADDEVAYADAAAALAPALRAKLLAPVFGGDSRQVSVRCGLEAIDRHRPAADVVLIHDAARPFVSDPLIGRAIAAVQAHGAAVPGLAVTDTMKQIDDQGRVVATPDRGMLRAVQTPQAFRLAPILDAHRRAADTALAFTDDAAVAEWAGLPVFVFEGDAGNVKLTTTEDFARHGATEPLVARTGLGYDVHAFGEGDHVWIGGVRIAHERGVVAHSDGDVVLHALTDALLGAIADGDIGTHFPPSDPRWRGASSDQFLAYAAERISARGGVIDHLDAVVICERPKIGPHREAIRLRIAVIAGISVESVSIKATTSEGLGFTGRREGIAAQAIASVRLPLKHGT